MDHVFSYENKFDSDAELLNAYVAILMKLMM